MRPPIYEEPRASRQNPRMDNRLYGSPSRQSHLAPYPAPSGSSGGLRHFPPGPRGPAPHGAPLPGFPPHRIQHPRLDSHLLRKEYPLHQRPNPGEVYRIPGDVPPRYPIDAPLPGIPEDHPVPNDNTNNPDSEQNSETRTHSTNNSKANLIKDKGNGIPRNPSSNTLQTTGSGGSGRTNVTIDASQATTVHRPVQPRSRRCGHCAMANCLKGLCIFVLIAMVGAIIFSILVTTTDILGGDESNHVESTTTTTTAPPGVVRRSLRDILLASLSSSD